MKHFSLAVLAACGGVSSAPTAPAPISNQTAPAPTTPAPTPAPVTTAGGLPIGQGVFGTANPTILRGYDKQERWMALCQARKDTDGDGKIEIHTGHHGDMYGDEFALYLILGGGEGTAIDGLPATSKDGRYLAVLRDKQLWLVDGQTGAQRALAGADIESDGRPGAPHRAAIFSGDKLMYIKHAAKGDTVVVHDPATGAEKSIALADRVWRLIPESDQLAQIVTVPQGQGFPQLMTSLAAGECLGPPMSYSTGGQRGPKPTFAYYDLATGMPVKADGIVATIGSTFVRAPKDGALYLDNDQIAPPTCAPQVLAVMPSPPRVIAICGQKKQAKILLLGKGLSKELASIDREKDRYGGLDDAIDPATGVVCDGGLHCIGVAQGNVVDLKGGVAEYTYGDKVYLVHASLSSRTHEIVDAVTGKRTPTKGADKKIAAGNWLIDYNDNLVDLTTGAIKGQVKGALRLATTGRVVKWPNGKDMQGPLSWSAP
jgi:hypothetical protein